MDHEKPRIPVLEWTFSIVGMIIVGGMLSFNVVKALRDDESPPDIELALLDVRPASQGFLVQVEARNVGGSSAAALMIEGALKSGDKDVETSEATFDYVAPHSSQKGGLFFQHDPRQHEVKLRVMGYQDP